MADSDPPTDSIGDHGRAALQRSGAHGSPSLSVSTPTLSAHKRSPSDSDVSGLLRSRALFASREVALLTEATDESRKAALAQLRLQFMTWSGGADVMTFEQFVAATKAPPETAGALWNRFSPDPVTGTITVDNFVNTYIQSSPTSPPTSPSTSVRTDGPEASPPDLKVVRQAGPSSTVDSPDGSPSHRKRSQSLPELHSEKTLRTQAHIEAHGLSAASPAPLNKHKSVGRLSPSSSPKEVRKTLDLSEDTEASEAAAASPTSTPPESPKTLKINTKAQNRRLQQLKGVEDAHAKARQRSKSIGGSDRSRALRGFFDSFDVDGDGFVSLEEVMSVFKQHGQYFDVGKLKELFDRMDVRKRGCLSFEDFVPFQMELMAKSDVIFPDKPAAETLETDTAPESPRNEEVGELKARLSAATSRAKIYDKQMEDAKVAFDTLHREHSSAQLTMSSLKSDLMKFKQSETSHLQEIKEWETRFVRESARTAELNQKVQTLTAELSRVEKSLSESIATREELRQQYQSEIDELKQLLRSKGLSSSQTIDASTSEALKDQATELGASHGKKMQLIRNELTKSQHSAATTREVVNSTSDSLRLDLANLRKQVTTLIEDSRQSTKATEEKLVAQFRQIAETHRAELAEAQETIDRQASEMADISKASTRAQTQLQAKQKQLDALIAEGEDYKRRIDEYKQREEISSREAGDQVQALKSLWDQQRTDLEQKRKDDLQRHAELEEKWETQRKELLDQHKGAAHEWIERRTQLEALLKQAQVVSAQQQAEAAALVEKQAEMEAGHDRWRREETAKLEEALLKWATTEASLLAQISTLDEQRSRLDAEKSDLVEKHQAAAKKWAEAEDSFQGQIATLDAQRTELREEKTALLRSKTDQTDEQQTSTQKWAEAEATLQSQISALESERMEFLAQIAELKENHKQDSQRWAAAESALQDEISALDGQRKQLEQEKAEFETSADFRRTELSDQHRDAARKWVDAEAALQGQIAELNARCKQLERDKADLAEKHQDATQKWSKTEASFEMQLAALDTHHRQSESDQAELESHRERERRELAEKHQKASVEWNEAETALRAQVAALESDKTAASAALEELAKQHKEAAVKWAESVAELRVQLDGVDSEMTAAQREAAESAEKHQKAAEEWAEAEATLRGQIATLEEQRKQLEEREAELVDQLRQFDQERQFPEQATTKPAASDAVEAPAKQAEGGAGEIDQLLAELTRQLEALKKSNLKEAEAAKKTLDQAQADTTRLTQENEKLRKVIDIYKEKQEQLRQAVESYEQSTPSLEKHNAELTAQLTSAKLKFDELQLQIQAPALEAVDTNAPEFVKNLHQHNVAEITAKIESLTAANAKLALQLTEAGVEHTKLTQVNSERLVELARLQSHIDALEKAQQAEEQEDPELNDQSATIVSLKSKIADLEAKFDACHAEKSYLEADRNTTLQGIHKLREQQADEAKLLDELQARQTTAEREKQLLKQSYQFISSILSKQNDIALASLRLQLQQEKLSWLERWRALSRKLAKSQAVAKELAAEIRRLQGLVNPGIFGGGSGAGQQVAIFVLLLALSFCFASLMT